MKPEDRLREENIQARVRESLNPDWQTQLAGHRKTLEELGAKPGESLFAAFARFKAGNRAARRQAKNKY
jgi:hypothetical protein